MKSSSFLWMAVLVAFLLFRFDGTTQAEEKPVASVTAYGHLKTLSNLEMKSVEIPWSRILTLEQIIDNLGGYDDYAAKIEIHCPGQEILSYSIISLKHDAALSEKVMKMKLPPGTRIYIKNTEC